jgi:hypothetical protein
MNDLEAQLLAAHGVGNKTALVALYCMAADGAPTQDEAAFFLTNAYIYALETAHKDTSALRDQLVAMGRESS